MESCKNCFSPIKKKDETCCTTCGKPLHKECAIYDGGTFCDVCYTVKQEEGDAMKEQFTIPDVIRRSYIETYKACPFKFYNEVIKGIQSPPTIYTQLGIDLHDMIDSYFKGNGFETAEEMKWSFDKLFKLYEDDLFGDVDKIRMYNRGINSIKNFYTLLPMLSKPFSTEETMQFSIGEDLPKVQCTSDYIELVDGELDMHDWKTGAVMVGTKLSSDLQAPLYIYGAREHYGKPVRRFTFHYLDDDKTRVFERVTPDEYVCEVKKRKYLINITDAIREVQAMFSQIKKGNFNVPKDAKKMYFTCKMCHLKAMEICKGCDIESWRQYN